MSETEKPKGYSLFIDGKLVAKGSRESFSAKYGVSLATVDTWVRKGRLPLPLEKLVKIKEIIEGSGDE